MNILAACLVLFGIACEASPISSPNATPLSPETLSLAGAVAQPNPGDVTAFSNQTILQQVQLSQDIRNAQAFAFQYGIDNIPTFGFSGYPKELIDNLKIWQAQIMYNINLFEQVLAAYHVPEVPPCKYTFTSDILTTPINSTDAYLAVLLEFTQVSLGFNLYLTDVASGISPLVAEAAAASASVEGRRAAYIKAIAGVNPTPTPFDTVIPSAFAYLELRYYIEPGSCPQPLPYGDLKPLKGLDFSPPLAISAFTPATTVPRGTAATFGYNLTVVPKYAAFLNQINPPVFVALEDATEQSAVVKIPKSVVGVVFLSLVSSNGAKDSAGVVKDTVAGPFNVLVS
ncbi:MAG: hypothetical protein M1828_006261 [Chrysothrix sp. TS-e1954]|nr:MAG: hypothetical protein M1828_006261 [Chrysothrix sp. TS-e1954]